MTVEIKVTNTEVENHFGEARVMLHGRDRDGNADTIQVYGFYSRFYAKASELEPIRQAVVDAPGVRQIVTDSGLSHYKGEHTVDGIEREAVWAVEVEAPWDVKDIADAFPDVEWLWTDVWTDNQLRIVAEIYSGVRAPGREVSWRELEPFEAGDEEFPLSLTFVDIESDDRGEFVKDGSRPVISIVGWNSLQDEVVGFFYTGPDREIGDCFSGSEVSRLKTKLDTFEYSTTEARMLEKFAEWVEATDPDVLSGWNAEDYDFPYLWQRFEALELDPMELSRSGWGKFNPARGVDLKGRTVYDLLDAYAHTKFGELDSKKLDVVAKDELGEAKIPHPGLGYYEMWAKDPALLMEYNAQDVVLCRQLEDEVGILSFWGALRDEIGINYEDTKQNSGFIEMLARRWLFERKLVAPPTNYGRPDSDFEGAYVFPPYTGRAHNVVAVDLASLYPMTMWMLNASPETTVPTSEVPMLKEAGVSVATSPNGAHFRLDETGVLKGIVDEAVGMKSKYKTLKKQHANDALLGPMYAERYGVSKTVTNSSWGVAGWEPFFLFDEDVALSITSTGQVVIKRTAEYINEHTEGEVIYGDTDSCYVRLPAEWEPERCVEYAAEFSEHLNGVLYPDLAEEFGIPREMNRWEIECEGYCETFFQAGKKKRYAYKMTWKDGKWLDEPSYSVTGFETERSDTPALTKEIQNAYFRAVLDGAPKTELESMIRDAAARIDPTDPDWEAVGIPGGLGKELHEYGTDAHARGSMFMNALAGTGIGKGSKPKRVYLRPTLLCGEVADGKNLVSSMRDPADYVGVPDEVDVLAFEDFEDVPEWARDELRIDAGDMTRRIITKKLATITEAVGIDVDAAISGQSQESLSAWM